MNSREQMRRLTGLTLALIGLMNWMALIVTSTPARVVEGSHSADRISRTEAGNARLTKVDATSRARATAVFGKLPLSFVANQGQTDPRVKFVAESDGYSLFVTPAKAVINLTAPTNAEGTTARAASLSIRLVGANPAAQFTGVDQLPGRSSYLVGNDPAKWQADIPTFAKIREKNVYRGIDLVYYGNGRQLEYDFIVAAGANPNAIRLDFEGAEQMRLDENGDLVLKTAAGEIRHHSPLVYQVVNGIRREIAARVEIKGKHRVGFRVGAYDRSRPLIIDPVLSYSTYYANGESSVYGMTLDAAGNIYLTGYARPSSFQPTPGAVHSGNSQVTVFVAKLNAAGALQATYQGGGFPSFYGDVFVAKLNAAGSALVYSTYLGGAGSEDANAIAVDTDGDAYITGQTFSGNFPTTPGALQTDKIFNPQPAPVAFVSKINAAGSQLIYSTYLGDDSSGNDIAIDRAGNAYVTGSVSAEIFPTANAVQRDLKGGIFVRSTDGSSSWQNSSIGLPKQSCTPMPLAIDPQNPSRMYLGHCQGEFFKSTDGGNSWAATGRGLPSDSYITAIVVHPTTPSIIYVGSGIQGNTLFKSTDGGDTFTPLSSDVDCFNITIEPVAPLTMYGTNRHGRFIKSTDGGATWHSANNGLPLHWVPYSIAIHPTNTSTLYVGSAFGVYKTVDGGDHWTTLDHFMNAVRVALSPDGSTLYSGLTQGARSDAFVCKLNSAGNALIYSTYLGGLGDDTGIRIAIDTNGSVYVTGRTQSHDFPAAGAALPSPQAKDMNGFLAKLNPAGAVLNFSSIIGGSGTDTASGIALDSAGNVIIAGTTDSTDFPTVNPMQSGFPAGTARGSFVAKINPAANPRGPRIMNATVQGKKLMVSGEEFSAGAVILIDGVEQSTANDSNNQSTMLISKKAGKKIAAGQHVMITVRNADGTLSDEYSFTRPMQ